MARKFLRNLKLGLFLMLIPIWAWASCHIFSNPKYKERVASNASALIQGSALRDAIELTLEIGVNYLELDPKADNLTDQLANDRQMRAEYERVLNAALLGRHHPRADTEIIIVHPLDDVTVRIPKKIFKDPRFVDANVTILASPEFGIYTDALKDNITRVLFSKAGEFLSPSKLPRKIHLWGGDATDCLGTALATVLKHFIDDKVKFKPEIHLDAKRIYGHLQIEDQLFLYTEAMERHFTHAFSGEMPMPWSFFDLGNRVPEISPKQFEVVDADLISETNQIRFQIKHKHSDFEFTLYVNEQN